MVAVLSMTYAAPETGGDASSVDLVRCLISRRTNMVAWAAAAECGRAAPSVAPSLPRRRPASYHRIHGRKSATVPCVTALSR
jgi:hypothetical protein